MGKIDIGTKLIMKKYGEVLKAEISTNGLIKTEDGQFHKSPSGAARAFNQGRPINGWLVWKLEDGSSLDSLRKT